MLRNRTSTAGKAIARPLAARLAAFLLAVVVALSVSLLGGAHAHAASATHVPVHHAEAAVAKPHAYQTHASAACCDDSAADQVGQDNCCISAACGFCAPLPSAGFVFLSRGMPAAFADSPTSLSRDPPTLRRPPKLSVTA